MKKTAIIGIVVVVIVIAGVTTLIFANKAAAPDTKTRTTSTSSTKMKDMDMSADSSSSSASKNTSTPTATSSVTIQNYAFGPANITVKKGTTVTWTNQDSVEHDVVTDNGAAGPKSELLAKGKSYSYTFDTVGTFSYHCTPHPYMKATVTVTE